MRQTFSRFYEDFTFHYILSYIIMSINVFFKFTLHIVNFTVASLDPD